jgi:hypothetical protein
VIAAVKEVGLQVPLVVRLEGTNVDLGKQILRERPQRHRRRRPRRRAPRRSSPRCGRPPDAPSLLWRALALSFVLAGAGARDDACESVRAFQDLCVDTGGDRRAVVARAGLKGWASAGRSVAADRQRPQVVRRTFHGTGAVRRRDMV